MKMRIRILTFIVLLVSVKIVFAQEFNSTALKRISKEQESLLILRKAKINSLVRSDNYEERILLGEDSEAILTDVINGIPYYSFTHNLQARKTTGVEFVQGVGGLDLPLFGSGITIGVWDGGLVLSDHQEFQKRVKNKIGSEFSNHATHVTGTIAASGVNPEAKGMLPNVNIHSYYAFDDDLGPMAIEAANGLILSNHSYGLVLGWNYNSSTQSWQWFGQENGADNRFGAYTNNSRTIDDIAYNAPYYTIVWSAGNDRSDVGDGTRPPDGPFDLIGPAAGAKNIITVGAITGFEQYTDPSSAVISTFSSWGPTDDGRIKPDIVADGVGLVSASSNGSSSYSTLSGTSMSAPNVTGSLGLLQEYYRNLADTFMTAAQLKSLAIHSAREAGTTPGPDYRFGWGVLNCVDAVKIIDGINQTDTLLILNELANNDAHEYLIFPDTKTPITATIAWTDVPGLAKELGSLSADLVNDLDIYLIDDALNKVYPWKMNIENRTQAAQKGDNSRDNVEKIQFLAPSVRRYKLVVKHKNTLQNSSQKYALTLTYGRANISDDLVYWVNDGGTLNEAINLSDESGGDVNVIPIENVKNLVIDENSFSSAGTISLSNDISLDNIIFNGNKELVFNLNGYVLNISGAIYSSSDIFKITNGAVNIYPLPNEDISLTFNGSEDLSIYLSSSTSHQLISNLNVDKLVIGDGNYSISNRDIKLNSLTVEELAGFSLSGNHISLNGSLFNQSQHLISNNNKWTVVDSEIYSTTDLSFNDSLNIGGISTFSGQFEFRKLVNSGNIEFFNFSEVDTLILDKNSSLIIRDSLLINTSFIVEENGMQVVAGSEPNSQASLILGSRGIFCMNNITFENLHFISESVLNVGSNSTLTNTANILQLACDELIFADFDINSVCANSLITINNNTIGEIDSYSWLFDGREFVDGISNVKNPKIWFNSPGFYEIMLTASNANQEASYSKTYQITENSLPEVNIIKTEQGLVATVNVQNYQWFKNGIPILEGGNERILRNISESGDYNVVYFSEGTECNNRVSHTFENIVVSNNSAVESKIKIFPNPVSNVLTVKGFEKSKEVLILNIEGKIIEKHSIDPVKTELEIDVSGFQTGLYFLKIVQDNRTIQRKFLIK